MYIREISFSKHWVLGNGGIVLTPRRNKPASYSVEDSKSSYKVVLDNEKDGKNHFTYIIGANGVGKSSFLRTLIEYIYKEERPLTASCARAGTYFARHFSAIMDKQVYESNRIRRSENHNFSMIHISNSQTVLSEGERYDLREVRPVDADASLVILPLLYMSGEGKKNLDKLERLLLTGDKAVWGQRISFADEIYEAPLKGYATIHGSEDVNALKFLRFIEYINHPENFDSTEDFQPIMHSYVGVCDREKWDPKSVYEELKKLTADSLLCELMKEYFKDAKYANNSGKDQLTIVRLSDNQERKPYLMPLIDELKPSDIILIPRLKQMGVIKYDIMLNNIPLSRFSSGEKMLINTFAAFAPLAKEDAHIIAMIDEPENSLHPQWQQMYPLLLGHIIHEVYGIKNSHFIIVTHSPLIIQRAKDDTYGGIVSVLKFEKSEGNVVANELKDVNRYCVEELMMDQFGIEYRDPDKLCSTVEYIISKNADPIESVMSSKQIKYDIDKLYQQVIGTL